MYYHGVINGLVDQKVLGILQDKEISSAAKRGTTNKIGFNEMDYISLCEYLGEDVYKTYPTNAFHKYILNHFCFVISKDTEVEVPVFIENASTMDRFELIRLRNANPQNRYSDIIDERQAKSFIPLDKILGVGIPYDLKTVDGFIKLSDFVYMTPEEFAAFITRIEELAKELGLDIYNSCSQEFPILAAENYGRK